MPVKNEVMFIAEAITSVLQQSYSNFELIIINDGSTDDTEKEINKFNDSRIIYLPTPGIGKNAAFNKGYHRSTGDYICYFAGDDEMTENGLEERIKEFSGDKEEASYSRLMTISKIKRYNNVVIPKNPKKGNQSGGTLMFSKKLAEKIFPLPEFLGNEDMWTGLHINHFCKSIYHIPYVSLHYRIHENNSNGKLSSFSVKNEILGKRNIVHSVFLEKYRGVLSKEETNKLSYLAAAETMRYNKNILPILFMKNLPIVNKIRNLFFGNAILYNIRNMFYSIFSGR